MNKGSMKKTHTTVLLEMFIVFIGLKHLDIKLLLLLLPPLNLARGYGFHMKMWCQVAYVYVSNFLFNVPF